MKMFNIKISKEGLQTIQNALECYSRLGINQFGYCLEHNPKFATLTYDDRNEIEKYLRDKIDNRSMGIHHPEVAKFHEAFQIRKEIQLHVAIDDNPIMEDFTNVYDGGRSDNAANIPAFYDDGGKRLRHEFQIPIAPKHRKKLKGFVTKKEYEKMWKYVGKYINLVPIRGSTSRISEDFMAVIISKPYKLKIA